MKKTLKSTAAATPDISRKSHLAARREAINDLSIEGIEFTRMLKMVGHKIDLALSALIREHQSMVDRGVLMNLQFPETGLDLVESSLYDLMKQTEDPLYWLSINAKTVLGLPEDE